MARILVIDDNDELRTAMRIALELEGHEVADARDGKQGIKIYRQQPFDMVVCDLVMPEKEGLETIQELRKLDPKLRLLAISGGLERSPMDFLPLAKAFGAAKTLHKPFETDEFLGAVNEILSQ